MGLGYGRNAVIHNVIQIGLICYTKQGMLLYMPSTKLLYAVRMPVDLKRMLDQAALSGGVTTSKLVIDACWKYLDRDPSAAGFRESGPTQQLTAIPGLMRASDLGKSQHEEEIERPMCSYTEWFDGEQYACGLREHSPKLKHTRGVLLS